MIEVGIALALAASGYGILLGLCGRLPVAALGWLAFPVGAALHMFTSVGLFAFAGRVRPGAALAATASLGAAGWAVAVWNKGIDRDRLVTFACAAGGVALIAWFVWTVHLTRLTPDSLRYLLGTADIQLPNGAAEVHPLDLLKRQFGYQALHALSAFTGRGYLAAVSPIFGVAGLGFFSWLLATRIGGARRQRWLIIGTAVAFLLSSNRLLYNFFYINGHLIVGVFMLIAVAGMWMAIVDRQPQWALPAGLALGATILMRPEAPLVAVLVLVPVAASTAGWTIRWAMTMPTLAALVLWYGMILWEHAPGGGDLSLSSPVTGNMVALTLAIAGVLLAGLGVLPRLLRLGSTALVPLLAVALAAYTVIDPMKLWMAVDATFRNIIGYGLWMIAWPVALLLLAVALFVHRVPESRLWTTPIMGFAVLFFLLPYIRESPWRVGTGDSGNRILMHMILVVVAFVIIALAGDRSTEDEPVASLR